MLQTIRALLAERGFFSEVRVVSRLSADGSDRCFFRLTAGDRPLLAILPGAVQPQAMSEAMAAYHIGSHLHGRGVAVPEILGFAPDSGLLLCEDLGDVRLHDLVQGQSVVSPEVMGYYRQAVVELARLQTVGREGFCPEWCWDTPRYDRELMLARESGYFRRALCAELLGLHDLPSGLQNEFIAIAERASREPSEFVLHRDFQSRNLMVAGGRLRIIDFQGARLGPLGYDLASLLIDPYVEMADGQRRELMAEYLAALAEQIPVDQARFIEGYYYLALQRNLQILGAFAFLSHQRGKLFFRRFIVPALRTLREHLDAPQGREFPLLGRLTERVAVAFEESELAILST